MKVDIEDLYEDIIGKAQRGLDITTAALATVSGVEIDAIRDARRGQFVESDAMFGRLREANIDYIQGYYVGRPVPIESLVLDIDKSKKSKSRPKSKPKTIAKAKSKAKIKSITKKKAS